MRKPVKRMTLLLAAGLCAAPALGQDWPQRPVRLVIPFAAGGNIDIAARIVSGRMQDLLGQPFVIDNRPGAGGLIASDHVANALPDGYTIFVGGNGPLLFMPIITGRTQFDWRQSFETVGALSFTSLVLQMRPTLGIATVKDFVELAKRRALNMGSGGSGSTNHLSSELLQTLMGARWTTIHYKGNAPAMTALLGGEVDFSLEQVSVALPLIREGKLRAIAVTSRNRFAMLPDVPTFEEAGFAGFEAVTWTGLFAPAGTPRAAVERLSGALRQVVEEPAIVKRFADLGSQTRAMSTAVFQEYVGRENVKWTAVIRQANIKAD